MGRRALFLAVLAASLALPPSALAAEGSLINGVMIYVADPTESNQVVFTVSDSGEPTFRLVDAPGVFITANSPCFKPVAGADNVMECPQDGNGSGAITLLQASLGDGNDTIQLLANLPTSIGAGGGADVMTGGPAADFLRGGQEADTIEGGGGNDQLIGDDPNAVAGGNDSLNGGAGDDSVDGQEGNDSLRGADGNDSLQGGGGNDLLVAEGVGDGVDVVAGGAGVDTASYAARGEPQQLSLDDQANDGFIGNAADNVLSDVENLTGGSAGDQLSGSAAANQLDGAAGADTLSGQGGDDVLNAADGNDSAAGGEGADTLNGQAGDDSFDGGPGPDLMNGGDGADTADYSSRAAGVGVTLDGNPGDGEFGENDNVAADVENLRGGSGGDTFVGNAANNAFDGGGGEDYQDGAGGADALTGGASGDVLRSRAGTGPAAISCGDGPDFVIAKAADTVTPDCDRVDRGVNQRPRLRDSALVTPAGGSLQMSPTGIVRRVPLQDRVVLPLRSLVDTVAGTVRVTSAAGARTRQTIALEDGLFNITQTAARLPITQFALRGGDFAVCPPTAARGSARSAAKPKTIRTLWAKGKGRFRTKGRYAAAAIRGTRWQTVDRCDGTLIRVTQGVVNVRDLVRKRTIVVSAGDSYLARARR